LGIDSRFVLYIIDLDDNFRRVRNFMQSSLSSVLPPEDEVAFGGSHR
jgi:hypothetical protein